MGALHISRFRNSRRWLDMDRENLEFRSGGDICAAWLYPVAGDAPVGPIVVMAHGLSGTRRDGLGPFAERFAAAGVAALLFDHRGSATAAASRTCSSRRDSSTTGGDVWLLDGRRQRARRGR